MPASFESEVRELDNIPTDDQEEIVLLTDEDHEDKDGDSVTSGELQECSRDEESNGRRKTSIKLLLIRTPWFIIGLVILVMAVVLSQYRVHLPYQQTAAICSDNDTIDNDDMNFTNSSIIGIPHTTPSFYTIIIP